MRVKIILITLLYASFLFSQETKFIEKELSIPSKKVTVNGNLLSQSSDKKTPLVIIIPGSGANDRDGNSSMMKNNSLKFLAEGLAENNIASYRYDKNTLELIKKKALKEEDMTFNDLIDDAINVINHFKNESKFSKIILAGHSQGSLVSVIAARGRANAFISLAGPGRPINEILLEQLSLQAPAWKDEISKTVDSLKNGKIDKNYNPLFSSIFRISVQPFLISWMAYNPQVELKKLNIPILIVNGTKDIQVPVTDAALLYKSNLKSQLAIIENMNHVFKEVTVDDREQNIATYNNIDLPAMPELITVITKFVNSIK